MCGEFGELTGIIGLEIFFWDDGTLILCTWDPSYGSSLTEGPC